jgi:hypothetical protein
MPYEVNINYLIFVQAITVSNGNRAGPSRAADANVGWANIERMTGPVRIAR